MQLKSEYSERLPITLPTLDRTQRSSMRGGNMGNDSSVWRQIKNVVTVHFSVSAPRHQHQAPPPLIWCMHNAELQQHLLVVIYKCNRSFCSALIRWCIHRKLTTNKRKCISFLHCYIFPDIPFFYIAVHVHCRICSLWKIRWCKLWSLPEQKWQVWHAIETK